MKSKFLLSLLSCMLLLASGYAAETEPNNTVAQANTLTVNGSNTGKISTAGDVDFYRVTTTADGRLNIVLTKISTRAIAVTLYDNNGTTVLSTASNTATFSQSRDGLAAGTYYIKVQCVSATDTASYTIADSLFTVAQANDTTSNDTRATALSFAVNTTRTGHIGYYYNNKRDTSDWYRVVTTADGVLRFTLTPATATSIALILYDNNGTTIIDSLAGTAAFTITRDGLAAGTYYLRIKAVSSSSFAPYTLANTFTAVALANDAEPNDARTTALTATLNSTRTGHVGYYYNNRRDTSDWYKITTTSDRRLKLNLNPANGHALTLSLYANNGTSLIGRTSGTSAFSLSTDGLKADVYYVKINANTSSDFAPYTFADSVFTPSTDSFVLAQNFQYTNRIATPGAANWWKLNTNADGRLDFTMKPLTQKYIYLTLYDRDKTTLLASSYGNSSFKVTADGLAQGTYYVKVNAYYTTDTLSYTISDTLTAPSQAVDAEPNNTRAQALTFNLNSTRTGHVGYYNNNRRDTADWYRLTTTADGKLDLKLTPANGSYAFLTLFDNDGNTLLNQSYSNTAFTISTDGLAAGIYYIKVNAYYSSGFTPYTLTNTFTPPAQANDTPANESKAAAIALTLNSSRTGHIGYYYNNKRDTTDWYKITTTGDGLLNFTLTAINGQYVYITLYDSNATTQLNQTFTNAAVNLSTNGLAAGTYYIKINGYYTNGFTPYILSNTLTLPAEANDPEPNGTRATALSLTVNNTRPGHIGYYYNGRRDTADWYRITTTADGMLKLKATPANGSYIYVTLFDNNGTTQIAQSYGNAAFVQNIDGLAAGTYYVKVNCYYTDGFTPYTITDSLYTYSFANDAEPNRRPSQGKLITANTTETGHVGFYYNQVRDTVDWWRLNYTGSGNLQFTLNLAPWKVDGGIPYVYFQVYRDTTAAPVFSNYYNGATQVISLTALVKATYYIKVFNYYSGQFIAYSFTNTFTAARDAIAGRMNTTSTPAGNVNVYPNPASTQLHVPVSSQITAMSLRDANNRQVWSQQGFAASKGAVLTIDVAKYPSGIYFLQLTDAEGKNTIQKIVISR